MYTTYLKFWLSYRILRTVAGIKSRTPTDSVFKEFDCIMYRVYNNDYPLFYVMFVMIKRMYIFIIPGSQIIIISPCLEQDLVR